MAAVGWKVPHMFFTLQTVCIITEFGKRGPILLGIKQVWKQSKEGNPSQKPKTQARDGTAHRQCEKRKGEKREGDHGSYLPEPGWQHNALGTTL